MTTLAIFNAGKSKVDKKTMEAQEQWVKNGSVSESYIKRVLGDISKSVSILPREKNLGHSD